MVAAGVEGSEALGFKDSAIISISLPISDDKGEEPREFAVAGSSSFLRAGEIGGCMSR